MSGKAEEGDFDIFDDHAAELESKSHELLLAADAEDQEEDAERDEIFAIGVEIGRMEAMGLMATVAISAIVEIYKRTKETKAWAKLKNGDGRRFESLEEFCDAKLGKSYRRLREIAANYDALGKEAFELAEKIGLRQSDYNIIKALPAPKQELIKDALEKGAKKEDVQRALRELAAADQQEIDSLAADKADLEKRANVLERELEKTAGEYRRFKEGLKRQVGKAVFADRTGMVREEAMACQLEGQLAVDSLAKLFDEVVREPMQGDPEWRARFEIVWIQAKALYARARLLVETMREAGATDDIPLGSHFLTADEASVWLADAELIYREHEAQKQRRELAREVAKPRGPGRPKGSGSKKGDE